MQIKSLVLAEITRRELTVKDFAQECPSPRSVQAWLYGKGRNAKVSTVETVLDALEFRVVPPESLESQPEEVRCD